MRTGRLTVILGIATAALSVAVMAQTDVSGAWDMTIESDQGSFPATLTLQQDGEALAGSWVTEMGTIEFEGGMVSGNKLEFAMEIDAGGAFIEVTMTATVDGDEMMGTVDFGGYGGGDWTAKRKP